MFNKGDRIRVTWTDEEDREQGIKVGDLGTIMAVPCVGSVVVDLDEYPIERYMERGQIKVIK